MHETLTQPPEVWETSDGIRAAALRAGHGRRAHFLRPDEDDPAVEPCEARVGAAALPSTDALAEIAASKPARPSPLRRWKVRYALMLGLRARALREAAAPRLGTELRRHQVDALAGMLTELIAAVEKRDGETNGNGNGNGNGRAALADELEADEEDEEDEDIPGELDEDAEAEDELPNRSPTTRAPSAVTASGIRPRPARRSPPPASSRPPAPKAC